MISITRGIIDMGLVSVLEEGPGHRSFICHMMPYFLIRLLDMPPGPPKMGLK